MQASRHRWALVLAGGSGTRLATLTTMDDGYTVPKQYCTMCGGPTLLHQAIMRAARVVDRDRICVVVAEQHRPHWDGAGLAPLVGDLVVQPCNRGTAVGIMLGVLAIRARDAHAQVAVFPSDHFVVDEQVLADRVGDALAETVTARDRCVLLGMRPSHADQQLGYIVADGHTGGASRPIRRFVEKPPAQQAIRLCAQGALWNSFIFATRADTVLRMLGERTRGLVAHMAAAFAGPRPRAQLAALYAATPAVDFSREVLARQAERLRAIEVPLCGWSDLGTPAGVARAARPLLSGAAAIDAPESGDGAGRWRVNLLQRLRRLPDAGAALQ